MQLFRHAFFYWLMSFRLGRIVDCEGRLQRDFKEFARLWADVKEDWLDERCRKFEAQHLTTLGPSLNRLTAELQEFCDTVRQANADLADEGNPEDLVS